MKRKIIFSAIVVAFFALAGVVWFAQDVRSAYRDLTQDSPDPLDVLVEDQMLIDFRKEVGESEWRVHVSGDSGISDLLKEMGFRGDVLGLAELFAHQVEPFDWRNMERNEFNLVAGTIRGSVMPKSADGIFHLNEARDFGVVFVRDGIVQFYSNTEDGLVDGILTNIPDPSNKTVEDNQYNRSVIELLRKL